jgi:hypothetical protein
LELAEKYGRSEDASNQNSKPASAIQVTAAAGVCAAPDMFCEKHLPQAGFISQEQISLGDFLPIWCFLQMSAPILWTLATAVSRTACRLPKR